MKKQKISRHILKKLKKTHSNTMFQESRKYLARKMRNQARGCGLSGFFSWKSAMARSALARFYTGSHVRSELRYPTQSTLYRSLRWKYRESTMRLTSNSGKPSTWVGRGGATTRSGNVLATCGSRRLTWNTGWRCMEAGRARR